MQSNLAAADLGKLGVNGATDRSFNHLWKANRLLCGVNQRQRAKRRQHPVTAQKRHVAHEGTVRAVGSPVNDAKTVNVARVYKAGIAQPCDAALGQEQRQGAVIFLPDRSAVIREIFVAGDFGQRCFAFSKDDAQSLAVGPVFAMGQKHHTFAIWGIHHYATRSDCACGSDTGYVLAGHGSQRNTGGGGVGQVRGD